MVRGSNKIFQNTYIAAIFVTIVIVVIIMIIAASFSGISAISVDEALYRVKCAAKDNRYNEYIR